MNFPQALLTKVQRCTNQAMVDEALGQYELDEKVAALLEAMGNPIAFFSHGEISLDRQYLALSGSLLSGVWRDDYFSYEAIQRKAERMEKNGRLC
ncbi:MAG: hypothetical protein LBQ87_05315 [Candidatus Fibromonas sp.]|jgi:hypothetical protein|nr:hypothetical protein [Candidatus Fibromonas sp.]